MSIATFEPEMLPELPVSRGNTNLLHVIWQRKSLVILGIVIGLILGSLFYVQRTPIYASYAGVLVVPKSSATSVGTNEAAFMMRDYMGTQSMILRSGVIHERASLAPEIKSKIDSGLLKSFPTAQKPEDIVPEMMTALTVTRENKESVGPGGNDVLILTFKGTDAEESGMFLRCIIRAYQEFLDEKYAAASAQVIQGINDAKGDLETRIKRAEEALEKFQKEDNMTSLMSQHNGGVPTIYKEYTALGELIAKLKGELSIKETDYKTFQRVYDERGPQEALRVMLAAGQKNVFHGESEHEKKLQDLKFAYDHLTAKWGENHPDVVQVRKQMESIQKIMGGGSEKDQDAAKMYLAVLKVDVERTDEQLKAAQLRNGQLEKQIHSLNPAIQREKSLQGDLERAKALHQQVQIRTEQLESLSKAGGGYTATAISRPQVGRKISPIPFQVFAAAGLLGTMLGIGLAYLAEISDKSFRSPVEIRRRLGLPVIGHVPFLAADDKATQLVAGGSATVDPMLVTHYQSNSIGAEAYRGVRTALYFSTRGQAHQVIQVTSPNVSDGKSTLAANLAVSIAQSGKRTLLIDADFRKPRVHKIFNVPAHVGIASVLVGQSDLNSAIQSTAIPNLSILPCGPRPVNPAELLTSPAFKDLLDTLRSQFDFVIIDTPPILVVTDPAVVAPRVDGVILCIRVTKNGRPFAERAREMLGSLGANVLGVVVNGFGAQVGGNKYGYEHYQYGYGEGYSYTYGYTYADKEAASYYAGQSEELAQPVAKD